MNFSAPLAEPLLAATQSWQNFYILPGTAAATLIGPMFIAVSDVHGGAPTQQA